MATWADVEAIAGRLDRSHPGVAHEGSPTFEVGRHPFARLRYDVEGRELLQFWSAEPDIADVLAERRETFVRIDVFKVKASVWARLDLLGEPELAEILTDSWRARRGVAS